MYNFPFHGKNLQEILKFGRKSLQLKCFTRKMNEMYEKKHRKTEKVGTQTK